MAQVDFTNLGIYNELEIAARQITRSVNGVTALQLSTDNGSTFFTTSGDYVSISTAGIEGAVTTMGSHDTSTTLARTGVLLLSGTSLAGVPKVIKSPNRNNTWVLAASTDPITRSVYCRTVAATSPAAASTCTAARTSTRPSAAVAGGAGVGSDDGRRATAQEVTELLDAISEGDARALTATLTTEYAASEFQRMPELES